MATDRRRGIGIRGGLPWKLKKDMSFFKKVTLAANPLEKAGSFGVEFSSDIEYRQNQFQQQFGNAVIMGRKTWDSIPDKFKPLVGRQNLILSRSLPCSSLSNIRYLPGFNEALEFCDSANLLNCFVIGGASLYEEAIGNRACRFIFYTEILSKFECDVFFPEFNLSYREIGVSPLHEENGIHFRFKVFAKK